MTESTEGPCVLAVARDGSTVRRAGECELEAILGVQKRAFGRVARMFDIPQDRLPPLVETTDDLRVLLAGGMAFFAAENAGRVVGSVRCEIRDGVVEIGRLVVDDGWQRRGIATALMDALEDSFPEAERFELFTGAEADVPLALYRGRGYQLTRTVHDGPVELVWLEKPGPRAEGSSAR